MLRVTRVAPWATVSKHGVKAAELRQIGDEGRGGDGPNAGDGAKQIVGFPPQGRRANEGIELPGGAGEVADLAGIDDGDREPGGGQGGGHGDFLAAGSLKDDDGGM